MLNVKNFHLKSAFLNFNSQDLNSTLSKQMNKNSKGKNDKSINKPSQRVQMLMKNFKLASKYYSNCPSNSTTQQPHIAQIQFQPPLIQQKRKYSKYMSCTLSPKKSVQKLSSPYQLYKSHSKDSSHKRRLSDSNIIKNRINKANRKQKFHINPESDNSHHIDTNNLNYSQTNHISQKSNQMNKDFSKSKNKIRVFQIDNFFNSSLNQPPIHNFNNNGSSFITTLPSKRKNFRTAKSSSLKERKFDMNNSLEKFKQKNTLNESQIISQFQQKCDDFRRSIHTARSVTARRIDYDKLNLAPVSAGFFPHSSIWNKQQQFVKHAQIKPQSYKLLEKTAVVKQNQKIKDNPCRPWSPSKPQTSMLNLQEQVFPQIKQH